MSVNKVRTLCLLDIPSRSGGLPGKGMSTVFPGCRTGLKIGRGGHLKPIVTSSIADVFKPLVDTTSLSHWLPVKSTAGIESGPKIRSASRMTIFVLAIVSCQFWMGQHSSRCSVPLIICKQRTIRFSCEDFSSRMSPQT